MKPLPPPIPASVYRKTEYMLRHRRALQKKAAEILREAEHQAYDARGPSLDRIGSGGGTADRLEQGAIRVLEARDKAGRTLLWDKAVQMTAEIYRGTDAGRCARMLFDGGISMAECAKKFGCDRQTVRRWKDMFVIRCAFFAAQYGLVRIDKEEFEKEAGKGDPNRRDRKPDEGSGNQDGDRPGSEP